MKSKMRFVRILPQVTLTICILISSTTCEKKPTSEPYILPEFKNPSVNTIKVNLESPSGLSSFHNSNDPNHKSKNMFQNIASGVFIEGPRFQNLYSNGGIQIDKNPKISMYEIDLDKLSTNELPFDDLPTNTMAEIDFNSYPSDFDSFIYYGSWYTRDKPDSIWRASRLLLDNCIINDDSILTSSNSSDKIFITNSIGDTKVFLEDSDLIGITDLVFGNDGEIFAAQAPLLDQNDPKIIIRPKRIISISNGTINTEFELPTTINSEFLQRPDNLSQWLGSPCLEQLKIIENSIAGKDRFGIAYYIADLLGNVIYQVDNNLNISVLARDLKYPTSIAIDSLGNLFYTSSPLLGNYMDASVTWRESLYVINPESGISKLICEFGASICNEYWWHHGLTLFLDCSTTDCFLPLDLNITTIIYETNNKLFFLVTNTRLSRIYLIMIDKET